MTRYDREISVSETRGDVSFGEIGGTPASKRQTAVGWVGMTRDAIALRVCALSCDVTSGFIVVLPGRKYEKHGSGGEWFAAEALRAVMCSEGWWREKRTCGEGTGGVA